MFRNWRFHIPISNELIWESKFSCWICMTHHKNGMISYILVQRHWCVWSQQQFYWHFRKQIIFSFTTHTFWWLIVSIINFISVQFLLLAVSETTGPVKYFGTVVNIMDQWHDKQCNTPNTWISDWPKLDYMGEHIEKIFCTHSSRKLVVTKLNW